jgi:hypothetical protein
VPTIARGIKRRLILDLTNGQVRPGFTEKETAAPDMVKNSGMIQMKLNSLKADKTGLRIALWTPVV